MKRSPRVSNAHRKGTPGPLFRAMQKQLNDHSNLVEEERRYAASQREAQAEQNRANEEATRKEQEREQSRVEILSFPKAEIHA